MSCDLTFSPFSKINPISRPLPVINSLQPVEIFGSNLQNLFLDTFSLHKNPSIFSTFDLVTCFWISADFLLGNETKSGYERRTQKKDFVFDSLAPKPPTSEVQTRVLED